MHKFSLVEELVEEKEITFRLNRIYETFDHVISVKEENIPKLFESCEKYNIKCEVLSDIKFIYENPLIDIFKDTEDDVFNFIK